MKLADISGIKLRYIWKAQSSNHTVRGGILETCIEAYVNFRRVTKQELA